MSTPQRPLPGWLGLLRRLGELSCVALAVTLTVANTATAPYVVRESLVVERVGTLPIKLDPRVYTDVPFVAELPQGTYSTLTLYRLPQAEGEVRKRILQFNSGDPRLEGDPVRVRLLLPSAEGEAPKLGLYHLVVTDDQDGIHQLRFEVVERELKGAAK